MQKMVLMIIDGNPFSRSGLKQTLSEQEEIDVMEFIEAEPTTEEKELLSLISERSPDVIMLDADYPSLSGLELGRQIVRHNPGTKVVMLSANPYENDAELFEVIKTGAVSYLRSKHCTTEDLVEAIKRAANGEYPINDAVNARPKVAERVLRQFQELSSMDKAVQDVTAPLTPKELQILTLIAEGNSNKQIATTLGISDQTIKNHVSAILRKINANYRAHAVYIAIRDGLISIQTEGEPEQEQEASP